jgi:hypothetical protein
MGLKYFFSLFVSQPLPIDFNNRQDWNGGKGLGGMVV